jgi:2-polyprenyl-3-methyl-5-hydroxy-6-metoxy-1,4-benzoquinol methylase
VGLFQTVKRAVPLEWKVAFHKRKTLPRYMAARVSNRLKGQPPLPPPNLIYLVNGHESPIWFLDSGRHHSKAIREILAANNLKIEQFTSVLDFGCGAGRIMRHWSSTRGPAWHGTDYNRQLIDWCRVNLKFSQFNVNTLSGKLPYRDQSFDFIYAYSVFTHLNEELQFFWINELSRVLKPGGYIYFTTQGAYYLQGLKPAERELFAEGQPVIREQQESGSNLCATFHPPRYVHEVLAQNFTVLDFIPGSDHGWSTHDIHLVKKPL